mmetsp:Transcript_37845/g.82949  ORF Transcript_37845/g.82949 Transcript_37845/m.82949 type:complete len:93 (+) Transcript_37845:142-420(+)
MNIRHSKQSSISNIATTVAFVPYLPPHLELALCSTLARVPLRPTLKRTYIATVAPLSWTTLKQGNKATRQAFASTSTVPLQYRYCLYDCSRE